MRRWDGVPFKWPKPLQYFRDVRIFLINLGLIISLFVSAIFTGIYLRNNQLLLHSVKEQAVSYIDLIVNMRAWNSHYDGVYVEKKEGVGSNPYLRELGIEPDLTCSGGKQLTRRNPAIMTTEISQLFSQGSGVRFHLVSARPINPQNKPDAFEAGALERFEKGAKELWAMEGRGDSSVFRYIKPLYVEQSCIACHGKQGYKQGDIRGGISVSIQTGSQMAEVRKNKVIIFILAFVILGLLLSIIYFMVWRLVKKLHETQSKLREMSITDELTGLRNRRFIMGRLAEEFQRSVRSGKPLGLIILDIDHFKAVNDAFGHPLGDAVLKEVAARLKANLREYDICGRTGGEEFMIVAPDTLYEDAVHLAERMRSVVKEETIGNETERMTVTVSAGVTEVHEHDLSPDTMISRADRALYQAKQGGRDKVAVLLR